MTIYLCDEAADEKHMHAYQTTPDGINHVVYAVGQRELIWEYMHQTYPVYIVARTHTGDELWSVLRGRHHVGISTRKKDLPKELQLMFTLQGE